MLIGNYSVFNKLPVTFRAGSFTAGMSYGFSPGNYQVRGWSRMVWQDGASASLPQIGYPSGYYGRGWKLPLGVSPTTTKIQYLSGMTAIISFGGAGTGILAKPGTGTATFTINADGTAGLVTSGSGTATFTVSATADILARLLAEGSATITITAGTNSASLSGLGWPEGTATLTIDGSATPRAWGWMEGTTNYTVTLTTASIAQAVWNALSTDFDTTGSMAELLQAAGAGGNPWIEEIENNYTAKEALRVIFAALAGKVSGVGTGTITFRDVNNGKDRIVADVDGNGNREAVTLDVS